MMEFKIGDYLKTEGKIYWIYVGNDIWLSEEILYKLPFDNNGSNIWEESSLKAFLNDTFKEKFKLQEYTDEIFLLSEEEFYDIDMKLQIGFYCGYQCSYWLRSPDAYNSNSYGVRSVDSGGYVYYDFADNSTYGVRPAFKLNPKVITCFIGSGTKEDPYM